MKSILLLRHAKSDWSNPALSDIDRPLAKRGLKDAPRMGKVLRRLDSMPDLIVSSPSMRTRQTVELSATENGYRGQVQWNESLYGGGFLDYLSVLKNLSDETERPMLVGHNPGMEEVLSALLTPRKSTPSGGIHIRVPTAGLAFHEANIHRWEEIEPGVCTLRWFLIPALVKVMLR